MRQKLNKNNRACIVPPTCLRRAGYTLSEVVVASALLVVALVPVIQALSSVHLNSTRVQHKSVSLNMAQSKLEYIRAAAFCDYDRSFAQSNINVSANESYLCSVTDERLGDYLRKIIVSAGYDNDGDGVLDGSEVLVKVPSNIAKMD